MIISIRLKKMVAALSGLGRAIRAVETAKAAGGATSMLRWDTRSGQDFIEHFITNPVLRSILARQVGDHGVSPSQVSAINYFFQRPTRVSLFSRYLKSPE
ncbi:MAG: hypothetical protein HN916_10425 [Anaerolineae bacterium]|jgi:hypothetical protein|nr:hypothetical protein [Anaerolineae bacterium]